MSNEMIYLNLKQEDSRQAPISDVWPDGFLPADDSILLRNIEIHFDLGRGALNGYAITRQEGNILVRPEAVFGS